VFGSCFRMLAVILVSLKHLFLNTDVTGNHPLGKRGGIHVIKIRSAASPRMGFSIRGGGEFGLGIYVSHVESASAAGESPCMRH